MLHVDLTLEDCRLMATRDITDVGKWDVRIRDEMSGESATTQWTDTELGAVMALAVCAELGDTVSQALYAIASPLFYGFPLEVRCIT